MKFIYILLFSLFILWICCQNKKEGFGLAGQLILPPLQQQIIYPGSSFFSSSMCQNDRDWVKGNLNCLDYSLENVDCNDLGDDGTSALESCPISCNSCDNEILLDRKTNKMLERLPQPIRTPSPVSELDDFEFSDYGEFDGMMGSDVGGYAGIYSGLEDKIDDLTEQIEELQDSIQSTDDYSCSCDQLESGLTPSECSDKLVSSFSFDNIPVSEGSSGGGGAWLTGDNDFYYPVLCGSEHFTMQGDSTEDGEYGKVYYNCNLRKLGYRNGGEFTAVPNKYTCDADSNRVTPVTEDQEPGVPTPTPCTAVDTPAGCTVAACTAVDTPYQGCTVAACTAVDTPYQGCSVPDCTTSIILPYDGCNIADCTALETPYEGCTLVQNTVSSSFDITVMEAYATAIMAADTNNDNTVSEAELAANPMASDLVETLQAVICESMAACTDPSTISIPGITQQP